MSHTGRIAQEGLVTEYEYTEFHGIADSINFPVTGHFVMIENRPDTMQLADDFTRMLHPATRVSLGQLVASSREGKKKFPRPYIYKYASNDNKNLPIGSSLVSTGEKVLIFFVNGNIMQPVVWGAVESLATISQKKFLRLDGYNLDRQPERYENDIYLYEFENDGKGRLTLDVVTKAVGTKQRVQVETGKTSIIQYDSEGTEKQHVILDMATGIKVKGQQDGKDEHTVYGETVKAKLEAILDAIMSMTVQTIGGPSSIPINRAAFQEIRDQLDEILVD